MALQPWERQPGESAAAYNGFTYYRDTQKTHRTLLNAYQSFYAAEWPNKKKPPRISGTFAAWASHWKWKDRADEFDAHLNRVEENVIEKQVKRDAKEVAHKRMEFRNTEIKLALKGFEKVEAIFNLPLMSEVIEEKPDIIHYDDEGKMVVTRQIVKTLSLDKDAARLLFAAATLFNVSSRIGRQGLGISDDEQDVTPQEFKDIFFRTRGQLEKHLPAGAMPSIPERVAVNPMVIRKPDNANGDNGNGTSYTTPPMERPIS